jgi:LAO/AO transport system kinase
VPDLIAVTKSDMGEIARRTASDLKGSISLTSEGRELGVLLCSATTGEGIATLVQQISDAFALNSSRFVVSRNAKLIRWSENRLIARFGSFGVELVHRLCGPNPARFSFRDGNERKLRLTDALTEAFL